VPAIITAYNIAITSFFLCASILADFGKTGKTIGKKLLAQKAGIRRRFWHFLGHPNVAFLISLTFFVTFSKTIYRSYSNQNKHHSPSFFLCASILADFEKIGKTIGKKLLAQKAGI
jgi:hypothetical protein